ncbi:hypothetical protein B0H10DRAFT_213226 [Mycena sp. CBHHK59/15]|nr:hypothetical protein B0H10DRAFT_213226 [Mycena sp. CBHHK59/15]
MRWASLAPAGCAALPSRVAVLFASDGSRSTTAPRTSDLPALIIEKQASASRIPGDETSPAAPDLHRPAERRHSPWAPTSWRQTSRRVHRAPPRHGCHAIEDPSRRRCVRAACSVRNPPRRLAVRSVGGAAYQEHAHLADTTQTVETLIPCSCVRCPPRRHATVPSYAALILCGGCPAVSSVHTPAPACSIRRRGCAPSLAVLARRGQRPFHQVGLMRAARPDNAPHDRPPSAHRARHTSGRTKAHRAIADTCLTTCCVRRARCAR